MLRIGFIGVGRIADMHYEGYKNNSNAHLYAICDSDTNLLNERANKWKVEHAYENYRDLLDDKNTDPNSLPAIFSWLDGRLQLHVFYLSPIG